MPSNPAAKKPLQQVDPLGQQTNMALKDPTMPTVPNLQGAGATGKTGAAGVGGSTVPPPLASQNGPTGPPMAGLDMAQGFGPAPPQTTSPGGAIAMASTTSTPTMAGLPPAGNATNVSPEFANEMM